MARLPAPGPLPSSQFPRISDKILATICWAPRVIELTETVAVICLLGTCQAVDIRGPETAHRRTQEVHAAVRALVAPTLADRRQDRDTTALLQELREDHLPLGPLGEPS